MAILIYYPNSRELWQSPAVQAEIKATEAKQKMIDLDLRSAFLSDGDRQYNLRLSPTGRLTKQRA